MAVKDGLDQRHAQTAGCARLLINITRNACKVPLHLPRLPHLQEPPSRLRREARLVLPPLLLELHLHLYPASRLFVQWYDSKINLLNSHAYNQHSQEDPNFHKYLRSEVKGTVSDAVLGEPVDAAQFQIVNGQLQQSIAGGDWLYAVVEPRANSTVVKLKVSWSATPATSGAFSWAGDTVEWSDPSISRPQNNVSTQRLEINI